MKKAIVAALLFAVTLSPISAKAENILVYPIIGVMGLITGAGAVVSTVLETPIWAVKTLVGADGSSKQTYQPVTTNRTKDVNPAVSRLMGGGNSDN